MIYKIIQTQQKMDKQAVSCLRDFQVNGKLGEGAFGQVFKVKRKVDGKEYALKKVKIGAMKEKERDNALNEIRILASYDGQNIIGYKEAFYDDASATLCIVMEFAAGGDLLKKIQTHTKSRSRFKEQQIWQALVHMTKGLKSLHDKKILHRDLKCANVFVTGDGIYKLGDLNVSKVLKKDMAQTQTGTPYYASPEVWKDKPYNAKSDMWSLGCVIYEMAALKPPFMANDLQGLYKKVCAGIFERIPMAYSNELAGLLSTLLKVDPSRRPSPQQILNNPIVQQRFKGQIAATSMEHDCDELLKTIKYNPKDLKGLRHILPKANYEEQDSKKEQKKLNLQDMRGGINSVKNTRKQAEPKAVNDDKLRDFLEKRRQVEEKQRERQLKLLKDEKQQISKKRERVMSACGVRQPYICDSPRMAVHNQKDQQTPSAQKKVDERNMPPKIPRPPGQNQNTPQQGINYKLPPRPSSRQQPSTGANSSRNNNQSYEYYNRERRSSSRDREKSYQKITSNERDKSKQNLRKAGQQIVSSRGIQRSSSAQKVVYPSWWG